MSGQIANQIAGNHDLGGPEITPCPPRSTYCKIDNAEMKSLVFTLIPLAASLILAVSGFTSLQTLRMEAPPDTNQTMESLYLPNGDALEFMSFGYRNVLSNIILFKCVSYFGKHFRADQNYRWLYHMVDLATTLDPNALDAVEFASTMLAWESGRPEEAIALLSKAIDGHKNNWRLYYYRGFTYMYFLHRTDDARSDFEIASKLPDAPPFLARLAAQVMAVQSNPEAAISFLRNMLETVRDPSARQALEDKLKQAYLELSLGKLREAVQIYAAQNKRPPSDIQDLVSGGIIQSLPPDPFGGAYYLDPDTLEVKTTSNRKGISDTIRRKDKDGKQQ